MESNDLASKSRGRAQVWVLVLICLFAALGIAYLARGAFRAGAAHSPAAEPTVMRDSGMNGSLVASTREANKQDDALLAQLQEYPEDPSRLAEIGKVYYQRRQFAAAAKYYGASANIRPDAAVLVKLGGAYHYNGENEKAIDAWEHALRLDPGNPDALFNTGFVRWRDQGNPKAAVAAWQKLLQTNPNHPKRAQVEGLLAQAKQHMANPLARNEQKRTLPAALLFSSRNDYEQAVMNA